MADYDLRAYGQMLTDEARIAAYTSAIRAAVTPGAVVLELGTATGFMAMLACQCGARRVYALEPSEAVFVAQQAARDNGLADRIIFERAFSTRTSLPEKCDVLISDLRGTMPCHGTHFVDLMDARERLLTPNARWICQTDTFLVAVADLPARRDQVVTPWDGSRWGLNLNSALRFVTQQRFRHRAEPQDLLTLPQSWAQVRYPDLASPHVRGGAVLRVTRDGPAHGLQLWFDAELFGGAKFSNAPGLPPSVYSGIFLPWEKIVPLRAGDTVRVQIAAVFSGHEYWWNWDSSIHRDNQPEPVASFKQSTFKGQIMGPTAITEASIHHRPTLTRDGEETRFILERMDGGNTQASLVQALRERFPERFPDEQSAFARISKIRRDFAQ